MITRLTAGPAGGPTLEKPITRTTLRMGCASTSSAKPHSMGRGRSPPGAGGAGPGPREGLAEPPRSGMYIGRLSDSTSPPPSPREPAERLSPAG